MSMYVMSIDGDFIVVHSDTALEAIVEVYKENYCNADKENEVFAETSKLMSVQNLLKIFELITGDTVEFFGKVSNVYYDKVATKE